MFQIRLLYNEDDEDVVQAIAIQSMNCHRNTGLHLKDKQLDKYSLHSCKIQYCIMWVYHG